MSIDDLGKAVEDRRFDLNLSQEALVDRGGPSHQIVRNIEKGLESDYRPTTFRKFDRALRWAPGSAQRLMDEGTPPAELAAESDAQDWETLAQAVKLRRTALRLPQDLAGRGGPSQFTVHRIERAEAPNLRGKTKTQLERVLSWPRDTVDELLRGEMAPDEAAELPASPTTVASPFPTIASEIDDDVALRMGRLMFAFLRSEGMIR